MWFSRSRATLALPILVVAAGCGRTKGPAVLPAAEVLDSVLVPATLAVNLRKAGGGHYHATAR